jgi:hypothetical protein
MLINIGWLSYDLSYWVCCDDALNHSTPIFGLIFSNMPFFFFGRSSNIPFGDDGDTTQKKKKKIIKRESMMLLEIIQVEFFIYFVFFFLKKKNIVRLSIMLFNVGGDKHGEVYK